MYTISACILLPSLLLPSSLFFFYKIDKIGTSIHQDELHRDNNETGHIGLFTLNNPRRSLIVLIISSLHPSPLTYSETGFSLYKYSLSLIVTPADDVDHWFSLCFSSFFFFCKPPSITSFSTSFFYVLVVLTMYIPLTSGQFFDPPF